MKLGSSGFAVKRYSPHMTALRGFKSFKMFQSFKTFNKDNSPQRHSAVTPQPEFGISRAKTQRRKGDGPRHVIPSEYEGAKKKISRLARNKDFSRSLS